MLLKNAVLFSILFGLVTAVTEDTDSAESPAISEETYKTILHFKTLGIDASDISPKNLGFESSSLYECFSEVEDRGLEKDAQSIALISCMLRHEPMMINELFDPAD